MPSNYPAIVCDRRKLVEAAFRYLSWVGGGDVSVDLINGALKLDQIEQSEAAWRDGFDFLLEVFKRYSKIYPDSMIIDRDASFDLDSSFVIGRYRIAPLTSSDLETITNHHA